MKSSLGSPTKEEEKRFQIAQETGCVACLQLGILGNPGDAHHLLEGGRRVSHSYTVILCPYHHRSIPPGNLNDKQAYERFGPSLAKRPREFKERFGDNVFLLELQNAAIEKYLEVIK